MARDRILIDDEIRKVWRTAESCGVYGSYIRFLLLTAARRNEASDLTWAEIAGNNWTLPAARNKTKLDLLRPLSRAARQIIEALPKQGEFVFTTNGGASVWRCGVVWRVMVPNFHFGLFGRLPNPKDSTHSAVSTVSTIK
jgi:integrase